jgi:hypothetical protein
MSSFERRIDQMTAGAPKNRMRVQAIGGEEQKQSDPVIIRKTPIMWGIPTDEVMYSRFFTSFFSNAHVMPWDAMAVSESTYLPKARNIIHNAFLDSSHSHLAMIDSDIMFPPYAINRLLAHKLPFVSGWYRNKKGVNFPVVYDFKKEEGGMMYWKHRDSEGAGLEEVDGVGAGMVLMSREVAQALGRDPYDMEKSGEDLTMCAKVRQAGFKIVVDWTINCAHLGVDYK